MLETFTADLFRPLINDPFRLTQAAEPGIALELIEVQELSDTGPMDPLSGQRRTPFSLLFRGPRDFVLAQQVVQMEHATLGAFELFIVPLGVDAQGARYEAVFT